MKRHFLLSIIMCLGLSACGTYYQDVPRGEPKATIRFPDSRGLLGAQVIIPLSINGVPSNSGRWNLRSFTVPPGKVEVVVVRDQSSQRSAKMAKCLLTFEAEAGASYIVTGSDNVETFTFEVKDSRGQVLVSKVAEKRDVEYRPLYTPSIPPIVK